MKRLVIAAIVVVVLTAGCASPVTLRCRARLFGYDTRTPEQLNAMARVIVAEHVLFDKDGQLTPAGQQLMQALPPAVWQDLITGVVDVLTVLKGNLYIGDFEFELKRAPEVKARLQVLTSGNAVSESDIAIKGGNQLD